MKRDQITALVERIARLPEEAQAEIVRTVSRAEARHADLYRLSDDERAGVRRGLEQLRAGELAPDEDVQDFFGRHRA